MHREAHRLRGPALAALGVALGVAAAFAPASTYAAADESLGRALYESRCTECHDRSVHSRSPRSAQSFDQIRAYVFRWDRELGGLWRRDEIDAVAQYLNERYYHYPCPQDVCGTALR